MDEVKLLIEGAVASELDALAKRLGPGLEVDLGGWRALICGGTALLNTGVGVANAAAATALACARLRPGAVISQGTAGAHDAALHTGDVVIGARIVRLGAYRSPSAPRGVDALSWQPLGIDGSVGEAVEFASDAALMALARQALTRRGYNAPGHPRAIMGTVGSGDVWNCEADMIARLHSVLGTSCEEMETCAAAQVCARMGVPLLSLRVISNNELLGESYEPAAARALQEVIGDLSCMLAGLS